MSERDDLDLIPSIKPAQDEVASYRSGRRSEAPRQSNFNGLLVFVIVLMVIMMGVGGYVLYQVQNKLDESNILLARGQANVKALEERLAATGTDVSKTLQIMQGTIDTNESEIRKLWDVTNKRNRQWIRENQTAIKANQQSITGIKGDLGGSLRTVENMNGRFENFEASMIELRQSLLTDNEEMTTQVSIVRGQIQDQAVTVGGNQRELAALKKQIEETLEDIKAIDAHRVQVNRQLLELRSRLDGTGAASGGPATP